MRTLTLLLASVLLTSSVSAVYVGDTVWIDVNKNGIQDLDEPGIAGVSVSAYNSLTNEQVGMTATTDDYGFYVIMLGFQAPPEFYLKFVPPDNPQYDFTLKDQSTNDAADSDADADGKTDAYQWPVGAHSILDIDAGVIEKTTPVLDAQLDIAPNSINLKSKIPWINCTIILPAEVNVETVDTDSLRLQDDIVADRVTVDTVNQTLTAKFPVSKIRNLLVPPEVELTVTGQLTDETKFHGSNTVQVKGGVFKASKK